MILTSTKFIIEGLLDFFFTVSFNKDSFIKLTLKNKLFLLIFTFIGFAMSYFMPKSLFPLNTIILFIVHFVIPLLAMKVKIIKSLFNAIAYIILTFVMEMLSVVIVVQLFGFNTDEITTSSIASTFIVIFYYLFAFITYTIINFINTKNKSLHHLTRFIQSKHFIIFILIIILSFLPQFILIAYNRYDYNVIFLVLNIIQVLLLTVYMLYSVYAYLDRERFKELNSTLETDNNSMIALIDGVRTVKHDFNNIFQAINGYICLQDYVSLEKYVNSIMKECNILNNISFLSKEVFDDPAVYGVVGSKHFTATNSNILFEIDMTTKISDINMDKGQLSRILGILLDNAIEATNKTKDKYIKLEMHFNKLKDATVIKIYNTYDTSLNIDLSKIFLKGYSSKKVKSGIGLWEVKKIIDNNNKAQIYASIENEHFVQCIIIEN